jgi:hypothetical protein
LQKDTICREDDSVIVDYRIMGASEVRDTKCRRHTDSIDTTPTLHGFAHLFDQVS